MNTKCLPILLVLLWLCSPGNAPAATQAAGSLPAGIPAILRVGKESHRVVLLAKSEGKLIYHYPDSPNARGAVDISDISRIRLDLSYDRNVVSRALRKHEWGTAAAAMLPSLARALPFVDLPGNNAARMAMKAGIYLMRDAERASRCAPSAGERQDVARQYQIALRLFSALADTEWFDDAETAALQAVICRAFLGEQEKASELLEEISVPEPDEETSGLYWLAQAICFYGAGDAREAAEAAAHSIAYETKSMDTFPVALVFSGHCYEKLENWYRARDIYYEVARLFGHTHWGEVALTRLTWIMRNQLTEDRESAKAQKVFLGIEEDMNAKARELVDAGDKDRQNDNKERAKP